MALSTLTATPAVAGAQAWSTHESGQVVARHVKIVASARTLSDIILLMKIPDQATIVDFYGKAHSAEALASFKLGFTGSEAALGTHTTSASATLIINGRTEPIVPPTMSLSDDVEPHYGYIYATCSAGTWTTTMSLDFVFSYTVNDK